MHDHQHDQSHDHAHGELFHTHAPVDKMRTAFVLTAAILIVEVIGGWLSHSLALLSDAGHVLTDIAALGLTWYAMAQSGRPANERMTFGYHRSGILAAFVNGVILIIITIVILVEAWQRFGQPEQVSSLWMFISAGVGLCLNLYLGLGLLHESDMNVRSAVLHMLGDAAASAGVIIGGIVISLTRWYVVDPLLSVLIALLIAGGAWRIVRQSVNVLMEATPKGIDLARVIAAIRAVNSVKDVHDVHVWSISSGRNALSCHVVLDGDVSVRDAQCVLRDIEHELVHLGIGHVTVQVEDGAHPHEDSLFCCDGPMPHHHEMR